MVLLIATFILLPKDMDKTRVKAKFKKLFSKSNEINKLSALHSYLIFAYSTHDQVSLDVGFYYMANAVGRLTGTVLSGWIYQKWGLETCLWWSAGFVFMTTILSTGLPVQKQALSSES